MASIPSKSPIDIEFLHTKSTHYGRVCESLRGKKSSSHTLKEMLVNLSGEKKHFELQPAYQLIFETILFCKVEDKGLLKWRRVFKKLKFAYPL